MHGHGVRGVCVYGGNYCLAQIACISLIKKLCRYAVTALSHVVARERLTDDSTANN